LFKVGGSEAREKIVWHLLIGQPVAQNMWEVEWGIQIRLGLLNASLFRSHLEYMQLLAKPIANSTLVLHNALFIHKLNLLPRPQSSINAHHEDKYAN